MFIVYCTERANEGRPDWYIAIKEFRFTVDSLHYSNLVVSHEAYVSQHALTCV